MDETKIILGKEKQLKKTVELANKTLQEAYNLEELKEQISKLQKVEDNLQPNVSEELKNFDNGFKTLLKNYRTTKYKELLDNLKATTEELEELTGGEPVNSTLLIADIHKYSECSECYTEFFIKCRRNIETSDNCKKTIEECQNIV